MPATPTLPVGIVNKIKARSQSVRWTVTLKEVRVFSAYCCNIDSDAIMGVAKQPVPIVSITPNPVCLSESIDWDLTDSYAPGSTISAWSIDFGDETDDNGASIGSAFGSHTYAAEGSYTVTVVIEEGTGRTTTMTREVNVVDCSEPPVKWVYASTYGQGVWFLDRNAGDTDWQERNTGLTGAALYVNSLVMRPGQSHLPDGSHELWIATLDGMYKSDNSGKSWNQVILPDPSNAEFGNVPATDVDDLTWLHIIYDPIESGAVYLIAQAEVETNEPTLVGEVEAATGAGPNPVCHCGFAGAVFFDGYNGTGTISRSTITPGTPSISGRTEIYNDGGILTTLAYNRYNTDQDAFLTNGFGAMIISPPGSGSVVLPQIDSIPVYIGLNLGDIVSATDMVSGNYLGGNPALYQWLENIGTSGDFSSWDLGDSGGTNYHIAVCMYTSLIALVCGVDESGNLFARTVRVDYGDTELESVGVGTSSLPCSNLSTADNWLRKLSASSFALVYNDGSNWQIVEITVSGAGASVTIGSANTLVAGIGTPCDVAVIDDGTLAIIGRNGSDDVYVSIGLDGNGTTPVIVNSDPGAVEALAVGVSGGYALVSYLKDSDDSLYVASVEL